MLWADEMPVDGVTTARSAKAANSNLFITSPPFTYRWVEATPRQSVLLAQVCYRGASGLHVPALQCAGVTKVSVDMVKLDPSRAGQIAAPCARFDGR